MLARDRRLRTAAEFRSAVRDRRVSTRSLLVHWHADRTVDPARIGFVVSRAVGNAVTRNRVKRRLRHLCRERLGALPGPGLLVVRAKATAAASSYAGLGGELDTALGRLSSEHRRAGA